MRYVGQGHEITVPVPCHRLSQQDNASLREAFETKYREIYHRNVPGAEVEVITWSVLVTAPVPDVGVFEALPDSYNPAPNSFRTVFETRPLATTFLCKDYILTLQPCRDIVWIREEMVARPPLTLADVVWCICTENTRTTCFGRTWG